MSKILSFGNEIKIDEKNLPTKLIENIFLATNATYSTNWAECFVICGITQNENNGVFVGCVREVNNTVVVQTITGANNSLVFTVNNGKINIKNNAKWALNITLIYGFWK